MLLKIKELRKTKQSLGLNRYWGEKVIVKLYVKWKCYYNSFNSLIIKNDIVLVCANIFLIQNHYLVGMSIRTQNILAWKLEN